MAPYVIGAGGPPFGRTFFNVSLPDLLEEGGKGKEHRLTLFLGDGSQLEVCEIAELSDAYLVVRGYREREDACDLSLSLIPYGLIYRIEIGPKEPTNARMGFHWVKPRETRVRKAPKKGAS